MSINKKTKIEKTTLKSVLLKTLLFILGINLISGFIAKREFTYLILTTISSLLGMGVSIIGVYYFLNKKSFAPIDQAKGDILILLTFPFFLGASVGIYYVINTIINLF